MELYCKTLEQRLLDAQEQLKEAHGAITDIWALVNKYETETNLAIKILEILERIK
jgi:hypothetical protein